MPRDIQIRGDTIRLGQLLKLARASPTRAARRGRSSSAASVTRERRGRDPARASAPPGRRDRRRGGGGPRRLNPRDRPRLAAVVRRGAQRFEHRPAAGDERGVVEPERRADLVRRGRRGGACRGSAGPPSRGGRPAWRRPSATGSGRRRSPAAAARTASQRSAGSATLPMSPARAGDDRREHERLVGERGVDDHRRRRRVGSGARGTARGRPRRGGDDRRPRRRPAAAPPPSRARVPRRRSRPCRRRRSRPRSRASLRCPGARQDGRRRRGREWRRRSCREG